MVVFAHASHVVYALYAHTMYIGHRTISGGLCTRKSRCLRFVRPHNAAAVYRSSAGPVGGSPVFIQIHWFVSLHIYTQWGQTAVFYASAKGHSEVVKLLVQAGADLELQTEVNILQCHSCSTFYSSLSVMCRRSSPK